MPFSSVAKPTTTFSGVTKPTTTYTEIQSSSFKLMINSSDFLLISSTSKLLINKPGTGISYTTVNKPA